MILSVNYPKHVISAGFQDIYNNHIQMNIAALKTFFFFTTHFKMLLLMYCYEMQWSLFLVL